MSTSRQTLGICDICGFRYRLRDLKNHPQNKQKNVFDDENVTSVHRRSPMPETNVTVTDWLPT